MKLKGRCPECDKEVDLWEITFVTPEYKSCAHCFCLQDTGGSRCCKCGQTSHFYPCPPMYVGNTCSNATETS